MDFSDQRETSEDEERKENSLIETHMLFAIVKDLLHSTARALEWGGMSGTGQMACGSSGCRGLLVGTDICFLCCCLCSAKMAPCLFQMHIGEGFQDVIVAVNFWSHLTRELLVKCLANELDMSDPTTVSKADNNDTATEREMEKVREIRKVALATEMLLNLYWSKTHRTELLCSSNYTLEGLCWPSETCRKEDL